MTITTSTARFCQLLGMNCAAPTTFGMSWPDFCQRGGGTDVHADGWGLSYYMDHGLREFHDVEAASTSPLARFLGQQNISTCNMLAHIRYATSGEADLVNVHPFSREMWAINWCFCHNGQIPLFDDHPNTWLGSVPGERIFYPVGETDSEMAFCAILNALRAEFTDTMPSLPVLHQRLASLCQEMIDYNPQETILNFLLACGPHLLWVYSWPGRRPGSQVWNGLHYTVRSQSTQLADEDLSVRVSLSGPANGTVVANGTDNMSSASKVTNGKDDDSLKRQDRQVCIVATKPLTSTSANSTDPCTSSSNTTTDSNQTPDEDDEWVELVPGDLILFDEGRPHVSARDLFRVEFHGHGLDNHGKVLHKAKLEEDLRRFECRNEFYAAGGI